MNRYRRLLIVFICVCVTLTMGAQAISIQAPSHVAAGENFRVTYTVRTQEITGFRVGNFPSGLDVVAGPYTSSQSSYQMVNGHTSSSSSVTYTFTVFAEHEGNYTIPAAHAIVRGRSTSSRTARMAVVGHVHNSQGSSSRSSSSNSRPRMHNDDDNYGSSSPQMRTAGAPIRNTDLFIRVSANKRRVHEQEPVLLTYKVYTLVDLTQLEGKMPDLTGFHTQEVKLPQQKSFHREVVNGRAYNCVTWSQYVMYPQMTGKLEIPSINFKGIVVEQNRNVDPLEAFFNGGSGYVEVKKNIIAPGVTIQVDALPNKPTNFSGGVGRFNISASLSKKEVKAGEPVTLRVVVGGIGNLKLIKQPVVNFPNDFDKYDAKVTDKTRLTSNGVEGNMVYDFLAVPRHQGTYTIPAVDFVYYDVNSDSYRTIHTQAFNLNVDKGDGSGASSDYTEQNDKDIHDIMRGDCKQHDIDDFFFGSFGYWISLLIPLLGFVALLIVFRNRALEAADIVKTRSNRANKVATKRLKKANLLMLAGKQSDFYDEVLRALWGYVGAKLNMPVEELSRENIQENFINHHIDQATIDKFVSALDECEFERYAPGDPAGNMNKTFESAMVAIMKIEDVLNAAKKAKKHNKVTMFLFIFLLLPLSVSAVTKQNADDEYTKEHYQQAIKDYQEILQRGVSAELYYNLGNAYFRSDNITQAVLAYERAHMLAPGNNNIRFNLEFARSKTIDKITPEPEFFFVTWYKSIVNFTCVDNWARTGLFSIIMVFVLVLFYLFGTKMVIRKIGFFGGVAFFLLFIFSTIFAFQQKYELKNRCGAIIISPSASIKKTPTISGNDEFVIHEGTRVDITDKTMRDWREVTLDDGRTGWLQTKQIEEI